VRLSLSEISTVNASFADDVAAYAAAGFEAIGIWEFKLPDDDEANLELLRSHGLAVANCVPTVPSLLQLHLPGMEGPADPEVRIEALCASVERLARYEPECVICLSGPAGERDERAAGQVLVAGLGRIAARAREAGVRLGFEPINAADRETLSFVHSIAEALDVLDEAGLDDVGLMVDTYNLRDEDPSALVAAVERVAGVHVADAPADTSRGDRLLPAADGRSAALVAALRAAGWDASLDVEIFSTPEAFWGLSVEEAARAAYAAAAELAARTSG
jgi:sugar phosphate isomerase/epimerase